MLERLLVTPANYPIITLHIPAFPKESNPADWVWWISDHFTRSTYLLMKLTFNLILVLIYMYKFGMSNKWCFIAIVDIIGITMWNNVDLMFLSTLFIYRINIVSTFCTSNHVFIFNIVDIAMLYDIVSISCWHHLPLILVCIVHNVDIAMLNDIESTSCWHRLSLISLFTSFTSSTSQCCTI